MVFQTARDALQLNTTCVPAPKIEHDRNNKINKLGFVSIIIVRIPSSSVQSARNLHKLGGNGVELGEKPGYLVRISIVVSWRLARRDRRYRIPFNMLGCDRRSVLQVAE